MCYHAEIGRSVLKDFALMNSSLLEWDTWGWPQDTRPSTTYYHVESSSVTKGAHNQLGTSPGIGKRWDRASLGWTLGWPPRNKPLHICYHIKLVKSASKGVYINGRESRNWGRWGTAPLQLGGGWLPKNTNLPTRVIRPSFVVLQHKIV